MNETLKTIFSRKSVSQYTDKKIDPANLELLVRAGMAGPSGGDTRSWRFIVITGKAMLENISEALKYGKMIKNAAAAIIVCSEIGKSEFDGEQYYMLDCSAAAENILLAAESLGIGSRWISIQPSKERINNIIQLFDLPEGIIPIAAISLGHPALDLKPKDKFDSTNVHWEEW